MDIKEIGIGSVVVIGGAAYGISEYGLNDVLKEDLKYVAEVPVAEREAYMKSVTIQFTEFYNGAVYGTDSFNMAGDLTYELKPRKTAFVEVVQSHHEISPQNAAELKAYYSGTWYCEHEESLMFTDKGWTYTTKLKNLNGRTMVVISCKPPKATGLRTS